MKQVYDIRTELTGDLYQALIDYSRSCCTAFFLVVRDTCPINASCNDVIQRLSGFFIERRSSSEWPGTVLYGHTATVYHYRLCLNSAEVLKNAVRGLYRWVQPDYPEDLCLLRNCGTPWLVSIAHEREAYFELSGSEREELARAIPALEAIITATTSGCGKKSDVE